MLLPEPGASMKRQEFVLGLGGVEALFFEDLLHLLTAGFGT